MLESLTPGQQVVKIVHEEMVSLLGAEEAKIAISPKPPTVIMLVGLQAGKTTTVGKLGAHFKKRGRRPLLAACDLQRPAAVKQLQVLGEGLELPVFAREPGGASPLEVAGGALAYMPAPMATTSSCSIPRGGCINEELMDELAKMKEATAPQEILLVVDAMTGQDAVNVARSFHDMLGVTGLILTKLDGDARGGAALSVKAVTGCPIKFVGMEKDRRAGNFSSRSDGFPDFGHGGYVDPDRKSPKRL